MAVVYRVEKSRDYTVMSNYHLKDMTLSLKAKGLLSMMLSLPDGWDYSVRGLAKICKEGVDCIGATLKELEKCGYMKRKQIRDKSGKITDTEYTVYEKAQLDTAEPCTEKPYTENPYMDNADMENPCTEKPAQLNTNKSNTKELNTDVSNTYPIKSGQTPFRTADTEKTDRIGVDEIRAYNALIKENIEYDILRIKLKSDLKMLDDLVDIMTETVCTSRSHLTVASDTFPAEIVKSKLLKLGSEHIEYVIDCLKNTKTDIRKTRQYMLAALFNAPTTIETYYTAKVNHDMYGGWYDKN